MRNYRLCFDSSDCSFLSICCFSVCFIVDSILSFFLVICVFLFNFSFFTNSCRFVQICLILSDFPICLNFQFLCFLFRFVVFPILLIFLICRISQIFSIYEQAPSLFLLAFFWLWPHWQGIKLSQSIELSLC